jgi:uncharacterized protein
MPPELPLRAVADGVRLMVRLSPRARADRIDGIARLSDGTPVLKVSVAAPPADGRANAALLRLIATEWRLKLRDLAIVAGMRSRSKTVHIGGHPAPLLLARLGAAMASLPRS